MPSPLRAIDWGSIAPLRLRARAVAEGVYAGRAPQPPPRSGVEFGGHRAYVPGDDLRWLDRRALLRHDKLIVREFETETDRGLRLIVDASASMGFRGREAPAAKFAYAALIAAALARVALASGDPVGLEWLGGKAHARFPPRRAAKLSSASSARSSRSKPEAICCSTPARSTRAFGSIARKARRGTIIVLLSDLLDSPARSSDRFAALASGGRVLVALQILDPEEARFPFEGTVRLRALEGGAVIETDADATRARYLAALQDIADEWSRKLTNHGGQLLRAETIDEPAERGARAWSPRSRDGRSPATRSR